MNRLADNHSLNNLFQATHCGGFIHLRRTRMVFYTGLARLARDAGLTVREVNGWKSRTLGTRPNGMAGARGCLWHHTATSASAVKSRNNPTLNYMVNGLGYPLANFGLAWDGSIDV